MTHLLETDARRRVSLAKLGVAKDSYYLAERRADGSILLTPAEVRPLVLETIDRVVPGWQDDAATIADAHPSDTWETARDNLE